MRRKLSDSEVQLIQLLGEFTHAKPSSVAREYGIHSNTVRNIWSGRSWTGTQVARRDRRMSDDEVRAMRKLAGEGHGEHAIKRMTGSPYSRSSIRQVITGVTYKEVK